MLEMEWICLMLSLLMAPEREGEAALGCPQVPGPCWVPAARRAVLPVLVLSSGSIFLELVEFEWDPYHHVWSH